MDRVNVIVFSQSTPLASVRSCIGNGGQAYPFVCLSTHKLFDVEESQILNDVNVPVQFHSFADLINEEEMVWCDTHAYDIESEENKTRPRTPRAYYHQIMIEKNRAVLNNLEKRYALIAKYLCADDLGICADVWLKAGFQDKTGRAATKRKAPYGLRILGAGKRWLVTILRNIHNKIFLFRTPETNYIFLGSPTRIRPRLKGVDVVALTPPLYRVLLCSLMCVIRKLLYRVDDSFHELLQEKLIASWIRRFDAELLLTSLHQYSLRHTGLRNKLRKDMAVLQDGFLPENYTSRYCSYYFDIKEFWVWDRLSMGFFQKAGLPAKVCPFFESPRLPLIATGEHPFKRILVLTSGAGDWTALKNRSDEDVMVMAFVEVARRFPDLEIIYRCHPLWAHPAHQGLDSIERVDAYFRQLGLNNIRVSKGSMLQSQRFKKDKELAVPHESIEHDIEQADFVFGEHSFSMIDAAARGKIFASVNLTGRRDFFVNYTKLGFLHCTNVGQITGLIEEYQKSPGRLLSIHNRAVRVYNEDYS